MWLRLSYLVLFFFLLNLACQEATQELPKEKKIKLEEKPKSAGIQAWIYDFDPISQKFQYKKENTGITTGDPIRVAIRYFLDNNHLKGSFKELQLERIGMQNKKAAFIFSGRIASEDAQKDLAVFKMALDSTITKNYFTKDFQIFINGKKL